MKGAAFLASDSQIAMNTPGWKKTFNLMTML